MEYPVMIDLGVRTPSHFDSLSANELENARSG
jgi:hypothetical protein